MTTRRSSLTPYVFLTLSALCWASGWIIGRGLKSEIPPMAMSFFRWVFAVAIFAPFALAAARRDWPRIRRAWKRIVALGLLACGLQNALAYLGLHYTTATNGVLLNSFAPVMIIALSRIVANERLAPLQSAGVAVSLGGMVVILSRGSLGELARLSFNAGDLLVLVSMAMWAAYSVCMRWRPDDVDDFAFLFALMVVGCVSMAPLWVVERALGYAVAWSGTTLAALLTLGLFSSVLPYVLWHKGRTHVGANVAGLFAHLVPVFGVLLAWLILDERIHAFHIVGFALIVTGIFVTSRYRRVTPGPTTAAAKQPPAE
jgi:drug/metabolite transporter (DMT)-like permease